MENASFSFDENFCDRPRYEFMTTVLHGKNQAVILCSRFVSFGYLSVIGD